MCNAAVKRHFVALGSALTARKFGKNDSKSKRSLIWERWGGYRDVEGTTRDGCV